jgi:hypothetical protein
MIDWALLSDRGLVDLFCLPKPVIHHGLLLVDPSCCRQRRIDSRSPGDVKHLENL